MKRKDKSNLINKIEIIRKELEIVLAKEAINSKNVLQLSKKLDRAINEYYSYLSNY